MLVKRQFQRQLIKFPAEVSSNGEVCTGTTVWLSEKGFFVRSHQSFGIGTPVEIILYLTEDATCVLKGVVKFAQRSALLNKDNGMGIELTEKNKIYKEFLKEIE